MCLSSKMQHLNFWAIFILLLPVACRPGVEEKALQIAESADEALVYFHDKALNGMTLHRIIRNEQLDSLKKALKTDVFMQSDTVFRAKNKIAFYKQGQMTATLWVGNTSSGPGVIYEAGNATIAWPLSLDFEKLIQEYRAPLVINESLNGYEFKLSVNEAAYRYCEFGFEKADSTISTLLIRSGSVYGSPSKYTLAALIKPLDQYWEVIDRQFSISINVVWVSYPLSFADVLTRQVDAFKNDSLWVNSHNPEKPYLNLDYNLVQTIMYEMDVYYPLNRFLKSKGLKISDISVEKVGFLSEEDADEIGYSGEVKIPIPYMVHLSIEPN